jgi:hypothetical protein
MRNQTAGDVAFSIVLSCWHGNGDKTKQNQHFKPSKVSLVTKWLVYCCPNGETQLSWVDDTKQKRSQTRFLFKGNRESIAKH